MFLGKYGRHTSLPFLRPPLTTALLTLGKAHQVTLTFKSLNCLVCVRACAYSDVLFFYPAECYVWKWTSPPEPFAHAAGTATASTHQRQTHQQRKTPVYVSVCDDLHMLVLRVKHSWGHVHMCPYVFISST